MVPAPPATQNRPSSPPEAGSARIRLLLVDDHAMVRAGLRELLASEADLEVVGEAPNGEVGARLASELKPDVIVMDLAMPVLGGAEATKQILEREPKARILVLSAHEDATYARAVLGVGAIGYVLKRSACDELVRAIRAVFAGGSYVDPVLAESLLPRGRRGGSVAIPVVSLSERELEVVQLMARGYTAKEVADQLGLSPRTLETYKARAMSKLDLTTRADLIRYAARCGWLRDA